MPPKKEKQPEPKVIESVLNWITEQAVQAELAKRESSPVLHKLNYDEYRNTIAVLIRFACESVMFLQNPLASGFDNNSGALTNFHSI